MRGERDVVVVGGGPVGLAAAIAARRRGLAVTLVEAHRPPLDKACGEGIMPAGLAALAALGVELGDAGRAFSGIRYRSRATVAEADFPRGEVGRGVRRTALHGALVERAARVGVELLWGREATGLSPDGIATGSGEIPARFVVGADGLRSKVRAWAGLARPATRSAERFGVRRHLHLPATAGEGARVEVVFGERAEAYLTPLAGETGVALLWEGAARGFDDLVATRFPADFARRLAGATPASRDRGAGPFRQRARGAVAGRVALIGDAAGYVDALTGEGLALGFREAVALGDALAEGDLGRYARAARRLRRTPETITRLALAAARRPRLGHRLVAALARDPALFSRLLGALGAAAPLRSVGAAAALRLAGRLCLAPSPT
jgi:flavin-dependent dehydrogenase